MSVDYASVHQQLKQALEAADERRAGELIDAFVAGVREFAERVPAEDADRILRTLSEYALFDEMLRVARTVSSVDQDAPAVRRWLARALLERGAVTEAIQHLLELKDELERQIQELEKSSDFAKVRQRQELEEERIATLGLLGRAYQRMYVEARPTALEPRMHDLEKALGFYWLAYNSDPNRHLEYGVSHVALLARRERVASGGKRGPSEEVETTARELLGIFEERRSSARKLTAAETARHAEVLLALGRNRDAVAAMEGYVGREDSALGAHETLRQLRDVWDLSEGSPPGDKILPALGERFRELSRHTEGLTAATRRPGGRLPTARAAAFSLGPTAPSRGLERILENEGTFQRLEWFRLGLEQGRGVARLDSHGNGVCTGFLVDGSAFGERFRETALLLTVSYIFFGGPKTTGGHKLEDLELVFTTAGPDGGEVRLSGADAEMIWSSPAEELSTVLMRLPEMPGTARPAAVADGEPEAGERIAMIGHPYGRELAVTLGEIVEGDGTVAGAEKFIQYQAESFPGSAGSPVFSSAWKVVGFHWGTSLNPKGPNLKHGVSIARVVAKAKEDLAG